MEKSKKHKENPSIKLATAETVKGYKFIQAKAEQTDITVYNKEDESEKEINGLIFSMKQEVDKSQFVKIFISGFSVLANLKSSTKLLFEYVFYLVKDTVGKDKIYFTYGDYLDFATNEGIEPMSQTSFYRNLNELIENEVLYPTERTHWYFINVSYMFNGDRLTFLKEYHLKK